MWDYIPDHILADVLVRLPFESLARFKCFSKSWRDLINSSYITRVQSERSRLIQTYPHPDSMIIFMIGKQFYAFDSVVKKGTGLYKANAKQLMSSPATKFPDKERFYVVGSCNGIFCLEVGDYYDYNLSLWNPFTCSYFELPSPPDEYKLTNAGIHPISTTFGYDHINDDYKVIRWFIWAYPDCSNMNNNISPYRHDICVYSLKNNSWIIIDDGIPFELPEDEDDYYFLENYCTMANGSAHWIRPMCPKDDDFIVAFDLGTYKFRMISLNFSTAQYGYKGLCCLNGCLSLTCQDSKNAYKRSNEPRVADIWVMEEYGVETLWKKMASIEWLEKFIRDPNRVPVDLLARIIAGDPTPLAMLQRVM